MITHLNDFLTDCTNPSGQRFKTKPTLLHNAWKVSFCNFASEASYIYVQICKCPNNIKKATIFTPFCWVVKSRNLFYPLFVGSTNQLASLAMLQKETFRTDFQALWRSGFSFESLPWRISAICQEIMEMSDHVHLLL